MTKNKKAIGFYLSIVAAVLALAASFLYGNTMEKTAGVKEMMIIAAVVNILIVVGALGLKKANLLGWLAVIGAALCMYGMMKSVNNMLDPIGYVVSGLYQFSEIQGWVVFMAVSVVAFLMDIIAGFTNIVK